MAKKVDIAFDPKTEPMLKAEELNVYYGNIHALK